MSVYLITVDDIAQTKELSRNTNIEKKVKSAIQEAQEFDLRPVLGDELYLDILSKEPEDFGIYKDLVNGCTYEYSGRTYQHDGLKKALIYYAYARIIPTLEENATATGFVQKTNEFSNPLSEKRIASKVGQAVSGAQVYQARAIDYLNRKSSDFELWRGNVTETKTGGIRISPIGGRNKVGSSRRCRECGRYSCNCISRYI